MYSSANPQVSLSAIGQATAEGFKFASPSAPSLRQVSSSTWADISKAKRLLGWSPQISPADGFKRAAEWHLANREWLKTVNP